MKKVITLLLIAFSTFSFTAKAQVCNANFEFQFTSNTTVKFTPVAIGDSFNTVHYWQFGDGSSVSIPIATHTYTTSGVFSVTHIVVRTNPNGNIACRDSVTKQVTIQLPTTCTLQSYFTWQADSSSWNKIHFQNQSQPYTASDSIRWSFGDGTIPLNGLVGSLSNPTHVYPNAGTYTVCIRIKKNNSTSPCVSEICKTVVVSQPCNFNANFSFTATSSNPLAINFQNLSTPLASTDSIKWTFGDGTTSLDVNPTHAYTQPGTYTVCLRVKKNGNVAGTTPCVREICKTVVVLSPCNIQIGFTMRRDSLNIRKVIFTNTTITTTAAAGVKWSFGDGTSASTWNAVHEYVQAGTYRVCLVIEVGQNCRKEICDTVVIPTPPPACTDLSKFSFEKISNDNQKYKFTPAYTANDIAYTWTFGDATGSHDVVATHRYATAGTYTACLTAWRSAGCASTTCKPITVLPQVNCDSLHAGYTYQRDPVVLNKLYFYANANGTILDQTWTITKSVIATTPVILHQNNPSYVFTDTGYYSVCLKATLLGGCVKQYCSTIHIEHISTNACELQTYPNPANDLVNVNVALSQVGAIDAYVYNSMNVLVKEKHQQGVAGNNVVSIPLNGLTAGMYTIKVLYGGKICYAKFNKL